MTDQVTKIINNALVSDRTILLEPEAKEICRLYGIPTTKFRLAKNVDEAVKLSEEIGFPVVLKIVSPDIAHKSDVGGVILDLKTPEKVRQAYNKLLKNVNRVKPKAEIIGVLVQDMAPSATEVIVGMTTDPQFGPTLMFGLGGIFVEVLQDVSFRVAPITKADAHAMIKEIKAYSILEGIRGYERSDVEAIIDILLRVSNLVMDHREIEQLDLNPIFVYERGAKTIDGRIILSRK